MATTTTNYGLTKPGYGDAADIADINENMDAIDDALDAKDRSLATVNDGDTAEANIDEGALIYVRGHSTLADGLYKAAEAITSGTTLTGSILTAISLPEYIQDIKTEILQSIKLFPDPTNILYDKHTSGVTLNYTATEDCYICAWTLDRASVSFKLNNVTIVTTSNAALEPTGYSGACSMFLKSGDKFTSTGSARCIVMGLRSII